jgi:chitin disaccharide deacetylase
MKYQIVNADDFGASRGINRAVLELSQRGVLTSASLMIDSPAAADAVERASQEPALGIGLHVTLTAEDATPLVDFNDRSQCAAELETQLERFQAALGRLPTHLDSHQNVHRDARLAPLFVEFARRHRLLLREHSPARYFSGFYGQWDGATHPEQIGVETLLSLLASELGEGITELSCHPGYVDPEFESIYHAEREIELKTLSDPRFPAFVKQQRTALITFRDVPRVCGETT